MCTLDELSWTRWIQMNERCRHNFHETNVADVEESLLTKRSLQLGKKKKIMEATNNVTLLIDVGLFSSSLSRSSISPPSGLSCIFSNNRGDNNGMRRRKREKERKKRKGDEGQEIWMRIDIHRSAENHRNYRPDTRTRKASACCFFTSTDLLISRFCSIQFND